MSKKKKRSTTTWEKIFNSPCTYCEHFSDFSDIENETACDACRWGSKKTSIKFVLSKHYRIAGIEAEQEPPVKYKRQRNKFRFLLGD